MTGTWAALSGVCHGGTTPATIGWTLLKMAAKATPSPRRRISGTSRSAGSLIRVTTAKRAFSLLYRNLAEVIHDEEGQYVSYDFDSWVQLSEMKRQFEPQRHDWVRTTRISLVVPRIIRLTLYDRLPLPNGLAFTASPWAAGGRVFCLNEDGVCFVLSAGEKFELLHTNKLADDDMCMATPALAGSRAMPSWVRTQRF